MSFQSKNILLPLFILFVFFLSIFPMTDNDVWWHIKTGEYIALHRLLPATDMFSYTIFGKPWLVFEWLAQVCLYGVYAIAGLAGLTVFKALIVALIFALLMTAARGSSALAFILPASIAFLALRDGLRERPQIFTYLFTAAYVAILRGGAQRAWYVLPVLQIVWVNMHGPTAIIGFGLTALYIFFSARAPIRKKIIIPAAMLGAMFVNPHGYAIFVYFYTLFHERLNGLILEYQPPALSLSYAPFFMVLILAAMAIYMNVRSRRAGSLRDNSAIAIAALAACLAIRNIPIFCIIALPAIADALTRMAGKFKGYPRLSSPLVHVAAGTAIMIAAAYGGALLDVSGKYRFGTGDAHRARHAAEFLRQCRVEGNLFNDYDFGGYLIGKLYPEKKVFIDGRLVEFGRELVEKSYNYPAPAVWKELDDAYHFTAAIIPQERYYAAENFDRMNDWILVYWDDDALVYLKKCPENERLIRLFGYRILRPNSPWQGYLKQFPAEESAAELRKTLYFAPHCSRAEALLTYVARPPRPRR